jgi:hypothetical protein
VKRYVMKGEAALKQYIDIADNEHWETSPQEYRDGFIADLQKELELTLRQLLGEHGEVVARAWMEVEEVD